jgi:hypothetical protein
MRNIIIGLVLLAMTGCSVVQPVIDRFTIAPFDNNEYAMINKIRTLAIQTKPKCGIENIAPFAILDYVNEMHDTALLLKNYSQYLPKNEQSIKPINLTYQMVDELKVRYEKEKKVSKTYCELKLQSIADASESIQQAIGKRPRP